MILKNKKIEEEIGSGNFGKVYKGKWTGQNVAIKLVKSKLEELLKEANILIVFLFIKKLINIY